MCIMQFNGSLLLSLTIQLRNYINITYDRWMLSEGAASTNKQVD